MNTKAFKFAEEETYMMRPYQNFKELVLSSANSMGVKEGKISLKCLYWYLMYKPGFPPTHNYAGGVIPSAS